MNRLSDMSLAEVAQFSGLTEAEILERFFALEEDERRLVQSRSPAAEVLIYHTLKKGREQ